MPDAAIAVIPAHAGIQFVGVAIMKIHLMNDLDSGIRRNDSIFTAALRAASGRSYPLLPRVREIFFQVSLKYCFACADKGLASRFQQASR